MKPSEWIATLLTATMILSTPARLVADEAEAPEKPKRWAAFELSELTAEREESGRAYLRFLRVPSLSTGVYELEAGGKDLQRPHDRDEVYYVTKGKAQLEIDGEDMPVQPGSIVYVKAGVEHHFHSIEEDLTVLVVFAAGPTGD